MAAGDEVDAEGDVQITASTEERLRSFAAAQSEATSQGPHGRNVSIALPSIHCELRNCRSRAETSFTHV